jgi:hypothetical protein
VQYDEPDYEKHGKLSDLKYAAGEHNLTEWQCQGHERPGYDRPIERPDPENEDGNDAYGGDWPKGGADLADCQASEGGTDYDDEGEHQLFANRVRHIVLLERLRCGFW